MFPTYSGYVCVEKWSKIFVSPRVRKMSFSLTKVAFSSLSVPALPVPPISGIYGSGNHFPPLESGFQKWEKGRKQNLCSFLFKNNWALCVARRDVKSHWLYLYNQCRLLTCFQAVTGKSVPFNFHFPFANKAKNDKYGYWLELNCLMKCIWEVENI